MSSVWFDENKECYEVVQLPVSTAVVITREGQLRLRGA